MPQKGRPRRREQYATQTRALNTAKVHEVLFTTAQYDISSQKRKLENRDHACTTTTAEHESLGEAAERT